MESKRRIDLLGVDDQAKLVVIELKRDEDGGHMELQGLRYAAMVSPMTFDKAVDVYSEHLLKGGNGSAARKSLLDFLNWDEPDETRFGQSVRLILVAADFSKELTTSVIWLNAQGLDIKCVRMKPYRDGSKILVDVQQVIPLPEAADYQIQIREKELSEKQDQSDRYILRKRFWTQLLDYARTKTDLHANTAASQYEWVGAATGIGGIGLKYNVTKHSSYVELYIDRGASRDKENKEIFDNLQSESERIEADFGAPLRWERLDNKRASSVGVSIQGGYRDDETTWHKTHIALVDAMIRFELALRPHIARLAQKA